MKKRFYIELFFLIILGILTSLSLPPFNYLILNFITFSLFFIFLVKKSSQHKSKKIYFLYGWSFGFGYFVVSLYWISISLTFDQNFKFLIPFTILLIPSFLAIFYGLICYFFIILKKENIISTFLLFCAIFGILEFLRGTVLTGFPWNLIVYSFSKQIEFLSIVSVIGTYGLNLFCISLFTSPAIFFLKNTRKELGISIFFVITIIAFYFYGSFYNEKFINSEKKTYEYKVRVIGSKISLDRFYSNIDSGLIIEDLLKLSDPNFNEKTIFVWPEGILPGISQEKLIKYKSLFDEKLNQNHILIFGMNNEKFSKDSKLFFNSLFVYDNDLNIVDHYNKIKLVPFGEFLPFESFLKKIGLRSLTNNYQSFTKGNQRKVIEIKKQNFSLKILPLICYEIIYSGELFQNSDFDLILNISEDGWFGNSIGPEQHFVHSIFRAIESGKYVLRSSNNGIAAIINPLGVIEQSIKFGKSGYIDLSEIRKIQPTLFSKYGNKTFGLIILLYIFLIFSFNKMKNE